MGTSNHHVRNHKRQQQGNALVATMLSLVILAIVATAQIQASQIQRALNNGRVQGNLLDAIKVAGNNYTLENNAALQNGLPVTRGAVTLAVGTADGQTMSPGVNELIALGYLNAGVTQNAYLGNGTYRFRLSLIPAGCVPAQCKVAGHLYLDQPPVISGPIERINVAVGAIVTALGGDALFTTNAIPANFVGLDGSVRPNPVAGNPPNVVGVKVGYGSIGWGRFLVVGDPRDPNFQGSATVVGQITSQTGIGVRPNLSPCNLAEMLATGEILSRSVGCIRTAWLDGANGRVGVADALGATRVELDGANQSLTIRDAGGAVKAGFNTALGGALSTVFADMVVINASATLGASCPIPNASAWGLYAGQTVLMKCNAGTSTWIAVGITTSTAGTACPTDGLRATTNTGIELICRDGQYRPTADLLGKVGLYSVQLYGQGETVVTPVCDASMVPRIVSLGVVSACILGGGVCGNNTGSFRGAISPAGVVSIVGSDGTVAGTDAKMTVASMCATS